VPYIRSVSACGSKQGIRKSHAKLATQEIKVYEQWILGAATHGDRSKKVYVGTALVLYLCPKSTSCSSVMIAPITGILNFTINRRASKLRKRKFEAKAKRVSRIGNAMLEIQSSSTLT
jgi:hypothetical protein